MARKKTHAEKTHEQAVRQSGKRPSRDEQVDMLRSLKDEDVAEMMREHEEVNPVSVGERREEEPDLPNEPLEIPRSSHGESEELSIVEADLTRFFEDDNETGDTLREIRDLLRDLPRNIVDELRNG